jgi:hypothetical protein
MMVEPLRKALELDKNALNGHIIFQKDGCNMSLETPVAHALYEQLELLHKYGYKVVTVSELIGESPFSDYGPSDEGYYYARALDRAGYIVGYKNNTFQPERDLTFGELITMTTPKDLYVAKAKSRRTSLRKDFDYNKYNMEAIDKVESFVDPKHPYASHYKYAMHMGFLKGLEKISLDDNVGEGLARTYLENVRNAFEHGGESPQNAFIISEQKIKRSSIVKALSEALQLNLG